MAKSKPLIIGVGVVVVVLLVIAAVVGINLLSKGTTKAEDIVANAPIGCPDHTSVVVKSPEAGTQNITTSNSHFIKWTKDQGRLVFANYAVDTDDIYGAITGDRVLTVIKMQHQDTTAMTVGTYKKTVPAGEASPNQYTSEYNISTKDLAGGVFDNKATVKVDYIGNDYVCGTVTSQDSTSGINGQFIAKVVDKSN